MINITLKKLEIISQIKVFGICLLVLFFFNHFGEFTYESRMDDYETERWRDHIENESRYETLNNTSSSFDEENEEASQEDIDISTPEGTRKMFDNLMRNARPTGETRIAEPFVKDLHHQIVYQIGFEPLIGKKVTTEAIEGLDEYDLLFPNSKHSEFSYPKKIVLYLKSTIINFYLALVLLIFYNLFLQLKKNIRVKID